MALGYSERGAVLLLYGVGAAGGLSAVALRQLPLSEAMLLTALVLLGLALLGVHLARVRVYDGTDLERLASRSFTPLLIEFTYRRRVFEVLLDFGLVALSYYAAYVIRFDEELPAYAPLFTDSLAVVISAQMLSFLLGGAYRGVWRHMGAHDVWIYTKSIALGAIAAIIALVYLYRFEGYSRGVFVIHAMILFLLVVGSRLSLRLLLEGGRRSLTGARVLVYGAGDGGALVVRELRRNPQHGLSPVAFVDDDPAKRGKRVLGIPVAGGAQDLEGIARQAGATALVISARHLSRDVPATLRERCRAAGLSLFRLRLDIEPVDVQE